MLQFLLNPWMLVGLAGIVLPVIAHLLVRRRYRVVDWGAMQFLSPGTRTRRRLQLEDLLLLLLRILQIVILVLALARPWVYSGLFTDYHSAGSRDVVVIIDGSNSMARSDGITTLHQNARRRADSFLTTLAADDTVMLIDGRDVPDVLIRTPTTDRSLVTEQIDGLEPPGGYSNLRAACERAVGLLVQANGQHRDIIVFTDSQRSSWSVDDSAGWQQFDDLLSLPAVRPRLWVVDCAAQLSSSRNQISVGRLKIDPDIAVPGSPVRITTSITNHSTAPITCPVQLIVQGQRVSSQDRTLDVPADTTINVQLGHRFSTAGVHDVTVQADVSSDELAIDNASTGIATVRPALNVLLVESSTATDPSQHRTLFVRAALTPPADMPPWMRAEVVSSQSLTAEAIEDADVVILQDVDALPDGCSAWLMDAVRDGTGLFVATGPHTTPEFFDRQFVQSGLLPGTRLLRERQWEPTEGEPPQIMASSLQVDWLRHFQLRPDTSFLNANFSGWWEVSTNESGERTEQTEGPEEAPVYSVAQLTNTTPLLFQRPCGKGRILWMTVSLDTEWGNLPGRPDFVTFLYDAIFHLTLARTNRNVLPGEQIHTQLDAAGRSALGIRRPSDRWDPVRTTFLRNDQAAAQIQVRYDRVTVPGIYRLMEEQTDAQVDAFAADYDRQENSNEQLTPEDRQLLQGVDRLQMAESTDALRQEMYATESIAELWWLLLGLFLGLLVLESWITRRLVMERHGLEEGPVAAESQTA